MLLEELQKDSIEKVQIIIDGTAIEAQAILIQLRKDVATLQDNMDQLRNEASRIAANKFFNFYNLNSFEEFDKEEFFSTNEMVDGFEETSDGERITAEIFHFEQSSGDACEHLIFEKVFFLFVGSATEAVQIPDGDLRPELFGSRFVEICDLPRMRKKGAFIQQYFKTFSYFLQTPKKNHIVRGIKFRKFARKKKITNLLDQIKNIVNDPTNPGGAKKREETIKITFGRLPTPQAPPSSRGAIDRTFDFISVIELANTKTGATRIVFVHTLQDVKNRIYPLFSDRRANYYVSELAPLFNRTLANTAMGKTNYLEAAEMFLAPGMTIERNTCASNATSSSFLRDSGAIIIDALQDSIRDSANPSKDMQELIAIYESGPIKSLELVERETELLKDSRYLEVVGRALRKTSVEGGQSIRGEFEEIFDEINPRAVASDAVDKIVAQSRKITWQQLLSIAAATAASQFGVDGVLDEDYVRRLTIKTISKKFNDNQTLKAIFLTIPPAKLKELAIEFGFIKINSEPQIIRPVPLIDTGLSTIEDALIQSDDEERRQWLTIEEREERRNTRQDQELSELRNAAQINAFLLEESTFAGNTPLSSALDPSTGREIQNLSKAELRSLLRRQRRQLEENSEGVRDLLQQAQRDARQYAQHMESAASQLEETEEREARDRERSARRASRILGRQEVLDERQHARDVMEVFREHGMSTSATDDLRRPGIDLDSTVQSRYRQFIQDRHPDPDTSPGTPWYVTNRDEYEISRRYYESVIRGALEEEQRELLTEVIIYALNCNTQENGDQLERILEFVIFDLGIDNTIIGDILAYFEDWSKWINTWDINNIDFCQLPVVSIPGDGSGRTGIEFNFPPRIRLPHLNLLDIFRFIFEAILKAIFTALLFILKKIIQFLLSLIPDITFDFDICKMGNFLKDFKDALRNTLCNKVNGVGGPGLTAEELLCYEPFGGAQVGTAIARAAGAAVPARTASSIMNFVGASCSGLLPAEDFFDFLNGNLTETTLLRAQTFFADNPDISAQIADDPDSLADVGSAIGQIIDIGEIESSLLAFEPLLGGTVSELCQDPNVEDIFENLCVEDNPALVQELKEVLENNRRQQLEDSLKIIGYLADPESLAAEIEDSIPNLMHPSNIIPQLVKDNQIITIKIKDVPQFAVGRDQEELGNMNLNIINSNLNLMANSNNLLSGDLSENAKDYIELQEKASMFGFEATGSESLISTSLEGAGATFSTVVDSNDKFISNTSFSYDKASLISEQSNIFFTDLQHTATSIGNFETAKIFINQQFRENFELEEEFVVMETHYEELMNSVLAHVSSLIDLERDPEKKNIKLLINPKRQRRPGSFLEFAKTLSMSAFYSMTPREGDEIKFDIFPGKRKEEIVNNYLNGDFKQENTYRRFIENTRDYSKVLLSLSDAELITLEEAFISAIEAVILSDLPSLLAYSSTTVGRGGDTISPTTPFTVNDIIYKYYGGTFLEVLKTRINTLLDNEVFVVRLENAREAVELTSSGMISYILYEISKIKSERFLSTYGRNMFPTDAFCAAANKAVENISQTFNSALSAEDLAAKQNISNIITNSNLIVPFEAPSAFSNELSEDSFGRLQIGQGSREDLSFLSSTVLFELTLKSESNIQNVVEDIEDNPLFNSFFSIESRQRPLILDFLRGESSLRLRAADVFDSRRGTMAFLKGLYAQADTEAETLSVEDFLFAHFNIRLVYEIYATTVLSVEVPPFPGARRRQLLALSEDNRKIFNSESGHFYLLPSDEIRGEGVVGVVSLVKIISHQSSFLSKNDLSFSEIYENIHNNFINKFMSTNSPEGIIKSELAQNPELITFFQLCFPFSDIINAVTIYFSRQFKWIDNTKGDGIISRAPTGYVETSRELVKGYLNVINK
jgi:hypothetical protein